MKKPKIDLSKQGIQHFLLHHLEKLILGLAVVVMGVFFWFGFSTTSYDEKTPPELSKLASNAGDYIVKSGWEELKEYRKGDDKADDRIRDAKLIDISQYELGRFSGVAAVTRGLRPDPDILDAVPRDLEIRVFKAPILAMRDPDKSGSDYISELPDASTGSVPEKTKGGDGRGGRDGGRGGGLGAGGSGFGADEPQDDDKDESLYGDVVPTTQAIEMGGVRPRFAKLGSRSTKAVVTNVVAVNGIIEHKKLYQNFKDAFENAVGWYPPRDKPNYAYIQIQRQDKDGKWNDIGNKVRYEDLDETFPTVGPEIVHPDYYDQTATGPIPPITQFDYRRYATHSKVPQRIFLSTEDEEASESEAAAKDAPSDDGFNFPGRQAKDDADDKGDQKDKKDRGGIRKGSDRTLYEKAMKAIKPKAEYKLFRFFDVGVPAGQHKYRVRVWLKDPNNENPNQSTEAGAGKPKKGGRNMGAGAGGTPDAPPDAGDRGKGGDPTGSGPEEEEEEIKYVRTEIEDRMKDVSVRNRIDREKLERKGEDPAPDTKIDGYEIVDLDYCRPSEWVEFDVQVPGDAGNEFYAGSVSPGKLIKTDNGPMQVGDSSAELITSVWDSKYDTRIPVYREAYRGDVLNVRVDKDQPVHLLHPIDWSVRVLDKYQVNTDTMLVDVLGGESLPVRSEISYDIPGEVLIMDAEGKFHVHNNLRDATGYRHSLFKEDDSNEFGKRKKPKKKDRGDDGGGGGLGG